MDDGTTKVLRIQSRHSEGHETRTFTIALVTGEGGCYGAMQVERGADSRRVTGERLPLASPRFADRGRVLSTV